MSENDKFILQMNNLLNDISTVAEGVFENLKTREEIGNYSNCINGNTIMIRDREYRSTDNNCDSNSNIKLHLGLGYGHYIKLNNKYEYQNFFMPVISLKGVGDICFNFGSNGVSVSYEFLMNKNQLTIDIVDELRKRYAVEIYGSRDCLNDFANETDKASNIINNINDSEEETIGVSIEIENIDINYIVKNFFIVEKILSGSL